MIPASGWLYRFKKRHEIRELAVQGKKLNADNILILLRNLKHNSRK